MWLVKDGRVRVYDDDLDTYRRMLLAGDGQSSKEQQGGAKPVRTVTGSERRQKLAPLRKAAKGLEQEIRKLQLEKRRLERQLADPSTYRDQADIAKLGGERQALEKAIARAEERWLKVEGDIEAVG